MFFIQTKSVDAMVTYIILRRWLVLCKVISFFTYKAILTVWFESEGLWIGNFYKLRFVKLIGMCYIIVKVIHKDCMASCEFTYRDYVCYNERMQSAQTRCCFSYFACIKQYSITLKLANVHKAHWLILMNILSIDFVSICLLIQKIRDQCLLQCHSKPV